MDKIYCKNCDFFYYNYRESRKMCNLKLKDKKIEIVDKFTGEDKSFYLSPKQIAGCEHIFEVCSVLNKDNNCKYFNPDFVFMWCEFTENIISKIKKIF